MKVGTHLLGAGVVPELVEVLRDVSKFDRSMIEGNAWNLGGV